MTEIYLVGGTTARTDLDNYVSANISEENAIASMRRWQDYQGSYEDFHIDHIEIDDMAEHDSELLDKVAERFEKYVCSDSKQTYYWTEFHCELKKIITELKAGVEE